MPSATTTVTDPSISTFSQPDHFYRVRDFGQKWEATAQLLRHQGRPLLLALLYYAGPFLVAGHALQGVSTVSVYTEGEAIGGLNWLGIAVAQFGMLVGTAVVYGFVSLRLNMYEAPGYQLTPTDIWRATRSLGLYMGRWLTMLLLVFAGFFLLIAPSIYVAVVMGLLPGVVFMERDGLTRTFELIKGHWWSTAGLIAIAQIISFSINYIPSITGAYLLRVFAFESELYVWAVTLIMQLFGALAAYVTLAVREVVLAFNYFSIIEEQDSPGLEWRATRLGEAAPVQHNPDQLYAATDELL